MNAEISKFETFNAFKEVVDEDQPRIPVRWVVIKQKDDGEEEKTFKVRLCMRGDLGRGKENVRADSPTASKDS